MEIFEFPSFDPDENFFGKVVEVDSSGKREQESRDGNYVHISRSFPAGRGASCFRSLVRVAN